MNFTLAEAERLYELGYAVHWLLPRQKRPVESKWTTGARKDLDALIGSYVDGYNVGVRLGRASHVGDGYLAVIDCDVKSTDPKHRAEMETRLAELFPDLPFNLPTVTTGRGNGSCHLYVVTRDPAKSQRLSQSSEKVNLVLKGVEHSKHEKEALTPDEIAAGIHLRAAWEISAMGEGSQVVLPPSVHPDTGREYVWALGIETSADLPLVDLAPEGAKTERKRPELGRNGDFHPCPVDLVGSDLPDHIVDMILRGDGVVDRSAALFTVTIAMVRARFTDDEIMTVLTDPDTFLGEVAFDHRQTTSRGAAAKWIYDHTLVKVRRETDAKFAFDAAVEIGAALTPEEAEAQSVELTTLEWELEIERGDERSGHRPKGTLKNVDLILRGVFGSELYRLNEFSGLQLYGIDTPWGGTAGGEITDHHLSAMKLWFSAKWRFEPGLDKLIDAINCIALRNAFHPVRDYLATLQWDGVSRINTWLKDFMGAQAAEPYLSAVSAKVLVAMVARVMEPGKKFDQVLILEGKQGIGKSTALRFLAGDEWFSDAAINIADKDGVLSLRAAWLVELGELSGMRKADVDQLKEFISRTVDRIRVPYGRRTEAFPRQGVFIGTTNGEEYLKDLTGNRRFWPVKVTKCDFESIKRNRDQLFAEAVLAYDLGEALYLDNSRAAEQAVGEQDARTFEDTWVDTIRDFFRAEGLRDPLDQRFNVDRFHIGALFSDFGPLKNVRDTRAEQMRAAEALRRLGYAKKATRERGVMTRLWVRPSDEPATGV
jgi:predicted P-loop ATPase